MAQRDYKGRVLDARTKQPIPYVNIGIVEAGIGTVSDEEGLFHLPLEARKFPPKTLVLFSSLGYQSLNVPLSEIPLVFNEYPEIKMHPTTVELNEVVVSDKGNFFIEDFLGYKSHNARTFGYWKDDIALGGELSTKILAKKGLRKLNYFQFEILQILSDSLLLRVNIYDDDGKFGSPGSNLNKSEKNIILTAKNGDKNLRVDLSTFDIYVKDDFFISLELLKIYGNSELNLVLAATDFYDNGSYRRYASQDKWKKVSSKNMAYYLNSSVLVSEKVASREAKKNARKARKQNTVSGFVIHQGKMIANAKVFNNRSGEEVVTDNNGRYHMPVRKKDILTFSKKGFERKSLKIEDGSGGMVNVIMNKVE